MTLMPMSAKRSFLNLRGLKSLSSVNHISLILHLLFKVQNFLNHQINFDSLSLYFHSSINLSFSLFHCHYQFLFSTVIFKIALSLSLSLSYKLPISCSNRTPLSVAAMPRVKVPTKDAKRFDSYKVEEKYEEFIKPLAKF